MAYAVNAPAMNGTGKLLEHLQNPNNLGFVFASSGETSILSLRHR
jgi:hypothetical protein